MDRFSNLICISILLTLLGTGCSMMSSDDEKLAQIHLQLGVSHLQQGNYPQALKELLTAQQLDDSDPVIQNNLGLAYLVRERYDLAEKHIKNALKMNKDYTDARNNLVGVYIETGSYEKALVEANKVSDDLTYPFPEKAQLNLGIIHFKKQYYEKARDYFLKSLSYQKENCLTSSYYGRTLYEMKKFKEAALALDQAVSLCQRSQFDEPHYYSALTYFQLGKEKQAEARLEEVVKFYTNGQYSSKAREMLEVIRK